MNWRFLFCVFALPVTVFAWGGTGHRTVARLAEERLTPAARAGVAALLGGKSLVDIASWADDIRNGPPYRQTSWYHTEKIPNGGDYLGNLRRQLPADRALGGVVEALLVADRKLRDPQTSAPEQADALKFFVHFVGDSHQPLHTGPPDDEYGTQTKVVWMGENSSLHEIWDTRLITSGHADFFPPNAPKDYDASPAYARFLDAKFASLAEDLRFDPARWIAEGLARRPAAYDQRVFSDQRAYLAAKLPIVDERVYAAGLRLAAELNGIAAGQPIDPAAEKLWNDITIIVGPIDRIISLRP